MRLFVQTALATCLVALSSPLLAGSRDRMYGGHRGGHYGGGHHLFGWILCIVVLVLAVIGLVTIVRMLVGKKDPPPLVQPKSEAVRKLEVRFAETDLSESDFKARLFILDPSDPRGKKD